MQRPYHYIVGIILVIGNFVMVGVSDDVSNKIYTVLLIINALFTATCLYLIAKLLTSKPTKEDVTIDRQPKE